MNYLVNRPVIDLRREPFENALSEGIDYKQESQLLYNEHVVVEKEEGDWAFIKAVEQQKCLPDGVWTGYPGWVKKDFLDPVQSIPLFNLIVKSNWAMIDTFIPFEVSIGTRLHGIKEMSDHWVIQLVDGHFGKISKNDVWECSLKTTQMANSIIDHARKMIGFPYFWGGRSAYQPTLKYPKTSIDCSGFVQLLYRIHGIDVPRDAHDQYLKAKPCAFEELSAGDLIFSASKDKPARVSHVMIYCGNEFIIEATASTKNVREIPIKERKLSDFIVHYGKIL